MKTTKILLACLIIVSGMLSGCKKWIEVDPPTGLITGETVYENTATAVAAMNSVYFMMQTSYPELTLQLGHIGDDLKPTADIHPEYKNDYTTMFNPWENWYRNLIYQNNSVLEGVGKSTGIGEVTRKKLLAEAKFNRAFFYFYLVNLYGDVPLILSTDYKTNANIPRSSIDVVYRQIIDDLTAAQQDLSESFLDKDLQTVTAERIRPTKWAAKALLARVYLFRKEWALAEKETTELITNTGMFSLTDLDQVFLKNSKETIWALQPNLADPEMNVNTAEGKSFVPGADNVPFDGSELSTFTLDAFEVNDKRKLVWVNDFTDFSGAQYSFPFKYKIGSIANSGISESREYSVVFRLAEQYLIRAEARAQSGNLTGAAEDLNAIRKRAGLSETASSTQSELLEEIQHERQVELFSEGGFRWLDLKRLGKTDVVMGQVTPLKGGIWKSFKALFPIPYSEFLSNPALRGHQNPGYSESL